MSTAANIERDALDALRQARAHKRLAQHHRRQAQRAMARYAAMRDDLAQLGVGLTINGEAPEEGEHGRLGHRITA